MLPTEFKFFTLEAPSSPTAQLYDKLWQAKKSAAHNARQNSLKPEFKQSLSDIGSHTTTVTLAYLKQQDFPSDEKEMIGRSYAAEYATEYTKTLASQDKILFYSEKSFLQRLALGFKLLYYNWKKCSFYTITLLLFNFIVPQLEDGNLSTMLHLATDSMLGFALGYLMHLFFSEEKQYLRDISLQQKFFYTVIITYFASLRLSQKYDFFSIPSIVAKTCWHLMIVNGIMLLTEGMLTNLKAIKLHPNNISSPIGKKAFEKGIQLSNHKIDVSSLAEIEVPKDFEDSKNLSSEMKLAKEINSVAEYAAYLQTYSITTKWHNAFWRGYMSLIKTFPGVSFMFDMLGDSITNASTAIVLGFIFIQEGLKIALIDYALPSSSFFISFAMYSALGMGAGILNYGLFSNCKFYQDKESSYHYMQTTSYKTMWGITAFSLIVACLNISTYLPLPGFGTCLALAFTISTKIAMENTMMEAKESLEKMKATGRALPNHNENPFLALRM